MERVRRAVEEFNRYRAPEARASIVVAGEGEVVVELRGPFCRTCGVYDYFEDLVYFLEEQGVSAAVAEYREGEGGAMVVRYSVRPVAPAGRGGGTLDKKGLTGDDA